MFSNIVLPLLVLSAIYALAILACWAILGFLRVSAPRRILLSFLIFGTATGFLVALEWPQDSIYLYNFQIYEPFRRRGYATRALRASDDKARELGVNKISLHVFGHNHAAQDLYRKAGYDVTGVHMTRQVR